MLLTVADTWRSMTLSSTWWSHWGFRKNWLILASCLISEPQFAHFKMNGIVECSQVWESTCKDIRAQPCVQQRKSPQQNLSMVYAQTHLPPYNCPGDKVLSSCSAPAAPVSHVCTHRGYRDGAPRPRAFRHPGGTRISCWDGPSLAGSGLCPELQHSANKCHLRLESDSPCCRPWCSCTFQAGSSVPRKPALICTQTEALGFSSFLPPGVNARIAFVAVSV